MKYLHTMVRVKNLDESLNFFCNKLGMEIVNRMENELGRFTLVFLATNDDLESAKNTKAPVLELTYNWPDADGGAESYEDGRNFGHLAYSVDNIYDTCASLMNSGVIINRPPRDGHMAFIRTPDGISIELLQKGKALEPQEPWISMGNTGTW